MTKFLDTSFKDQLGREWRINLTGRHLVALRTEINVNLSDAVTAPGEFFKALGEEKMMGLAWIAVRDQVERLGLTQDDFLDGIYGQAMIDLSKAGWHAILNFSQGEKSLEPAGKLMQRAEAVSNSRQDRMIQRIEELTDEQIEQMIDDPNNFTKNFLN